jgi:hypothetical protein
VTGDDHTRRVIAGIDYVNDLWVSARRVQRTCTCTVLVSLVGYAAGVGIAVLAGAAGVPWPVAASIAIAADLALFAMTRRIQQRALARHKRYLAERKDAYSKELDNVKAEP